MDENPEIIICAFTISNDSIKTFNLPNARKKKVNKDIPRQKQMKSYPAVLIGRLGVHINYRLVNDETYRTGKQLMNFIKSWFIDGANKTGCRFIHIMNLFLYLVMRKKKKNILELVRMPN